MGPGSGLGIVPGVELVVGSETGPGRVLGERLGIGPGVEIDVEPGGTGPVVEPGLGPGSAVELPHDP